MKIIYIISLLLISYACQKENEINMKPVAGFSNNKDIIEEGASISFRCLSFDKDGEISKRVWDFGNGDSSTEKDPTVVFEVAGTFQVKLTVWDNNGEQNPVKFSKTITVKEKSLADVQPEIIWDFQTPAGFQDIAPAIDSKGNIVIGCDAKVGRPGGSDNILVINNGNLVWKYSTADVVRSSAAISNNDIIYIGSYDKKLYAFNALNNNPLGSFNIGANAKFSSPAIDSDGIVYYSGNKKLYAISPAPEMKELWSFDCENVTQSTPVIYNSTIYVASNSGYLYAVNKNGTLKWKIQFGTTCSSVPAIGNDGTIYLCGETSSGGIVMAITNEGALKWQQNFGSNFNNSGIALSHSDLYVGNGNNEFISLKQETGERNWTFKSQGKIISTPAIDNHNNIYFGDDKGVFYVLNKEGKMRYKEIKLGTKIWSSPAIGADGIIYICSDITTSSEPGKLYALRTIATQPLDSWSMRSGNTKRNNRTEM